VRSISDLERGINQTARKETTRLLADALNLSGAARLEFESAARGRVLADADGARPEPAGGLAAATRTLPRDVTGFTGRGHELEQLAGAAADAAATGGAVSICAIGGMAGVGKTAFAVHAAHVLAPRFPDGQIFLSLHGHTPGQRPVDPADALASLLLTAGVTAQQIPPGLEARARLWRDRMAGLRLLLVLDDAAGHEQVRPLLPGTAGSLVLVTSRRHLTALEDSRAILLDTMLPDEAAALLVRLAGRPSLDSGDAAVREIARLCGYLPLAVGMLARQLHHHPAWTCERLAADLASERDRLNLMHAENLSVAAAFDLSYQDLSEEQQRLFRRLSLHPGTDVDDFAAAALNDTDLATARRLLDALYDQHLLTEHAQGRYRLHDLIREHARSRAADDPAEDADHACGRLMDYYLNAACAAGRHLTRRSLTCRPEMTARPPACAPSFPAREDAVAWMDAERLDLHAVASYAAVHGLKDHVIAIPAAMHGFLRSHGHWDQALILHGLSLSAAGEAGDQDAEAGALTDLSDIQQLTGDYPAAAASLTKALDLYRSLANPLEEARTLNELGKVQQMGGNYPGATASHQEALRLHRDLRNVAGEAAVLNELGAVLLAVGDYPGAIANHGRALELYREVGNRLGEASALNRLGFACRVTGAYQDAAARHFQALRLHRDVGNQIGEASALNGLGVVHRVTGDFPAAAACHQQALQLYRDFGYRLGEAHALNALGALHRVTGAYSDAAADHEQALRLYREVGYRLGEGHALSALATLHQAAGDLPAAAASHEQALRLYRDLGYRLSEAHAVTGWP